MLNSILRHSFCQRSTLFVFMILVFFCSTVYSQKINNNTERAFRKNSFGISAGFGFSGIRDQDNLYNEGKMLASPNVAFVYQRNLFPHLGIRTGIGYIRKGDIYKYPTGFPHQTTNTKVHLHYIELPVLITIHGLNNGTHKVSPYMNAGMALGYAVGQTGITTYLPVYDKAEFRKFINKEIANRLDNSLVGSAGFKFNGKTRDFFVEIQYSYSLSNVFYYTSHNNVIAMHVGLLFGK
jgi:hypothetical protein